MSADVSTRYLGFTLRNPLVVSACPLTGEIDVLKRLEEVGAAAVVLPSLFAEQITPDAAADPRAYSFETDAFGQCLNYFRELSYYNRGPELYLKLVEDAKKAISIPVIGSLNGVSPGGWCRYARSIQNAGADALEMNLYSVNCDPEETAEQVESRFAELIAAVRAEISIPLAVKVGPYFTAFANTARRFVAAGADGLVLFNRFMQPEIDVDKMRVVPHLVLSNPEESRVPLRWIAILRGQTTASLAATGGIHFVDGVLKALMVGADATMIASSLYRHGVDSVGKLREELQYWMDHSDFQSIEQMKGCLSQRRCPDATMFERANYTKALTKFSTGHEP